MQQNGGVPCSTGLFHRGPIAPAPPDVQTVVLELLLGAEKTQSLIRYHVDRRMTATIGQLLDVVEQVGIDVVVPCEVIGSLGPPIAIEMVRQLRADEFSAYFPDNRGRRECRWTRLGR